MKLLMAMLLIGLFSPISKADFINHFSNTGIYKTDSLLVSYKGKLIYEGYQNGYHKEMKHRLWSVSKSITNAMVGIAIQEGKLSLQNSICDYLELGKNSDYCKLKIYDLLFWSTGLDWSETFFRLKPSQSQLVYSLYGPGIHNIVNYIISQPLLSPPGKTIKYKTAETQLLSAILTKIYPDIDFFREKLFKPLQITDVSIERDQTGLALGGSHMFVTPRDLMIFMQFVMNQWHKRKTAIKLPTNWMQFSTTPHKNLDLSLIDTKLRIHPIFPAGHWWTTSPPPKNAGRKPWKSAPKNTFAALGVFGQTTILMPEQEIIIIRLSQDQTGAFNRDRLIRKTLEYVNDYKKNN